EGARAAGRAEVLAGEQRGRSAAHGHRRGQRQGVATGVTEHLEGRVAEHVPAEAQARAELVVDLDVGRALAVDVLERIPAAAQVGDEVVGDVPAVLDVVGVLLHLHRGALAGVLQAGDVEVVRGVAWGTVGAGQVLPLVTALSRGAGTRLVLVGVVAEADQVVAQLPLAIHAELLALVAGVDVLQRAVADRAAAVDAADVGTVGRAGVDHHRAGVARG